MTPRHLHRIAMVAAAIGVAGCTGVAGVPAASPASPGEAAAPVAGPTGEPAGETSTPRRAAPPARADEGRPATGGPATTEPTAAPSLPTGIVPARIVVERIGVDAPVVDLMMTATEVEVPAADDEAGWWTATRRPGELGPAVIGGHVDSRHGPAVFFRLRELVPGDVVVVESAAGEVRRFVVERLEQLGKASDPDVIFGFGEPTSELRLVTCSGRFDPTTGHYEDNLVVHATAISS